MDDWRDEKIAMLESRLATANKLVEAKCRDLGALQAKWRWLERDNECLRRQLAIMADGPARCDECPATAEGARLLECSCGKRICPACYSRHDDCETVLEPVCVAEGCVAMMGNSVCVFCESPVVVDIGGEGGGA